MEITPLRPPGTAGTRGNVKESDHDTSEDVDGKNMLRRDWKNKRRESSSSSLRTVMYMPGSASKKHRQVVDKGPSPTLLFIAGVILYSTNSLLVIWSKGESSHFHYVLSGLILASELVRGIFSVILLSACGDTAGDEAAFFDQKLLMYAFPAVMYAINDELALSCMEYMDATTFQTLSSFKILITALAAKYFLKDEIGDSQWVSLVMLSGGSCLSALSSADGVSASTGLQHAEGDQIDEAIRTHALFLTPKGFLLILLYSTGSAIGAVYSEWLLRLQDDRSLSTYEPLAMKFLKISFWGGIFSGMHYAYEFLSFSILASEPESEDASAFENEINIYAILLVINQALLGLVLSAVIRYSGAIAKLFMHTFSMILTMLGTIILLELVPSFAFCISFCIVVISIPLYRDTRPLSSSNARLRIRGFRCISALLFIVILFGAMMSISKSHHAVTSISVEPATLGTESRPTPRIRQIVKD
eukprot:g4342.t1